MDLRFLLRTNNFLNRVVKMITFMILSLITTSFVRLHNSFIRRMSIVKGSRGQTIMASRVVFRPDRHVSIRVINKLVRGRRIILFGRSFNRNGPNFLTT